MLQHATYTCDYDEYRVTRHLCLAAFFFYRDRVFKLHDEKQISVEKNKPVRRDKNRIADNTGLYTTSILH